MWEYPTWDVPRLGGGMAIGLIATIHVLVAHFSVGAGIILAVGETVARKKSDETILNFLRIFSKWLLLIGFVFGAVSGVAIWFSISLASTRATSMLIHTFVWFWAIEWVFFLVEIVSGYAYYASWGRISPRQHTALAWIYAIAAWMSLFIISGILSFMLSPGDWIQTRDVWDGFLNPTFLSTVALRTLSSLGIASLAAMAIVNLYPKFSREERTRVINFNATFLWPLVLMLPFAYWYFQGIPPFAKGLIQGGAAAMTLFFLFGIAASTLVGLYAYFGLIRRKRYINLETSLLLLSIAIIATVSMEFVREGVRKPYVIYNLLYSNGLTKEEVPRANNEGVLANAPWKRIGFDENTADPEALGEKMYEIQCSSCHVVNGFNDVVLLIDGWSDDLLWYNLERLHELKPFMPPLVGTDKERKALAAYLMELQRERYGNETKKEVALDGSHPQS
ncbi:MAG: cytochrome ubiquinol oxidase subunit I [Candidatus Omnitrophica bacterium]|nr:cytochrome ubiquinol oxidase subunit I [Candidatus Omnitrophota bacterium]